MLNKKSLLFSIFICLSLFLANTTLAQENEDASPSATDSLKNRIEKVVEEKKESVEKKMEQATKQKRGFIGRITRVSQEAITLENSKGTEIVPLEEQVIVTKDEDPIAIEDIAVDEWAIVMGYKLEEADFEPRKIIIKETQLVTDPQLVMLGTLLSYDKNSLTIRSRVDQQDYEFELSRTTDVQDDQGEKIDLNQLFEDMQLLVVGITEIESNEEAESNKALVIRSLAPIE